MNGQAQGLPAICAIAKRVGLWQSRRLLHFVISEINAEKN